MPSPLKSATAEKKGNVPTGRAEAAVKRAVSIAQQNTYGIVLAISDYQILNTVVVEISDLHRFREIKPTAMGEPLPA